MSSLHIKKTSKVILQNLYYFVLNNTLFSFDIYCYYGIKFTIKMKPFSI